MRDRSDNVGTFSPLRVGRAWRRARL